MTPVKLEECLTCLKPLARAASRHKCPHGIWCGIRGRPQLASRSRTCKECNREIAEIREAEEWLRSRFLHGVPGRATPFYTEAGLEAPHLSGEENGTWIARS